MARATGNGRVRYASMRATSTLLLAAQLLALSHLLVVRHTVCPEHGEAIHSESPRDAQTLGSNHEGAAADSTLGAGAPTAEHAATGLKKSTLSTRFYQLISPISGGLDLVRAESQELTTFSRNCQVCTIP